MSLQRCPCRRLGQGETPPLQDGNRRPKSCPHAAPADVVAAVLTQRAEHRQDPKDLGSRCGTSARTVPGFWPVLAFRACGIWTRWPGHESGLHEPPTAATKRTRRATRSTSVSKNSGPLPAKDGWRADPPRSPAVYRKSHQKVGCDNRLNHLLAEFT